MRSERRSPIRVLPDAPTPTLRADQLGQDPEGVSATGPGAPEAAGGRQSGAGTSPFPVELRVTDLGLIVVPQAPRMPSLLPWSEMTALDVQGAPWLPRKPRINVLRIEMREDGWFDHATPFRFAAPAAELGPFVEAVSIRRDKPTASALPSVVGVAVTVCTRWVGALRSRSARLMRDLRDGEGDPRHGLGRRRIGPVVIGLLAVVLMAGSAKTIASANGAHPHRPGDGGNASQAYGVHPTIDLPAATAAPAPAPPSLAGSPPLQPHEIFGYAPYWTLPQSAGFDVKDLTTLAYFSVDANADGTLNESGSGWNGYESQDLASLVTRAHTAGDRVVLTVTCFDQSSLDAISSDPNAPSRLSAALVSALSAKNLDGVNFDFEGEGSGDRQGLTSLITTVAKALHAANSHWQVTMATYASAAADSAGFYDVAAMAPALDGYFVMAYDMNDSAVPSATAPLTGGGFNDTEALQQFTAVVPPQKVILGVPFYGYDWPTTNGTRAAQPIGGEAPLSDAVIEASGHPTYWDPSTDTPWTAYQVGAQWHETFFDDPTSLALKAQLAATYHIAGLGIWALGMDGNNPAMLAALLGNAPAVKDLQVGPTAPPAPAVGAGYVSTGVWNGVGVTLTPALAPSSFGNVQYLGTLSGFRTNNPSFACLQNGPPINVWSFSTVPGVDMVVADSGSYCTAAVWTFPAPPGQSQPSPTSTVTTSPSPTVPPTTPSSTTSSTTTTTTTASSSSTTSTLGSAPSHVRPG